MEPAGAEHLPALGALAGVIWRACYTELISTAQIDFMLDWMYAPRKLGQELKEGTRFDRLLIANEFVGFASYGPHDPAGTFKLHKLYLHPAWHGQGLGRFMLRHSEQNASALGASRMTLNVNKRNCRAIRIYERNGYTIVDAATVSIGHGFVMDDFIMAKRLP
jgi:GNAT superfamily N-acetyltransferase